MSADLTTHFNKFAGQEVSVTESETKVKIGNDTYTFPECTLAENDPVITAINDLAAQKNLLVRVWLPGSIGTMDMRPNRLNVYINKGTDNKWRVNQFVMG